MILKNSIDLNVNVTFTAHLMPLYLTAQAHAPSPPVGGGWSHLVGGAAPRQPTFRT